jgi:hypothetical protein
MILIMCDACGEWCDCKIYLNNAAAGLAEASRLLSASIQADSDEAIELYYSLVRAAKARFCGAMAAYKDHLCEARIRTTG